MDTPAPTRPRNADRTKARILAAAQQAFAERGYAQAGLREIAAAAEVSPSLPVRYFGSKAGLFEAALMAELGERGLFGDRAGFGARMASALGASDLDVKLPAMIMLAAGDEEARGVTARIANAHIIAPLAEWLGDPDAETRAAAIIMLATGFVLYTRQIPLMAPPKELIDWVAASLQAIVDR